jgi:8-oxo-dGTP diphosphatase
MKNIVVTAAIIIENGHILCMQRNQNKFDYISYKYEFPGGKVEALESNEEALKREIHEELKIDLESLDFFMTVNHEYPDFSITMHAYLCEVTSREFTLTEHIDYRWLKPSELNTLDWAAADMPIVEKLRSVTNEQ